MARGGRWYDGSGRFRDSRRWGLFYGLSAGRTRKASLKHQGLDFIDLLKLRASYGELGNQAVPLYSYLPTVNLAFPDMRVYKARWITD